MLRRIWNWWRGRKPVTILITKPAQANRILRLIIVWCAFVCLLALFAFLFQLVSATRIVLLRSAISPLHLPSRSGRHDDAIVTFFFLFFFFFIFWRFRWFIRSVSNLWASQAKTEGWKPTRNLPRSLQNPFPTSFPFLFVILIIIIIIIIIFFHLYVFRLVKRIGCHRFL